jgi:hypothetical protein
MTDASVSFASNLTDDPRSATSGGEEQSYSSSPAVSRSISCCISPSTPHHVQHGRPQHLLLGALPERLEDARLDLHGSVRSKGLALGSRQILGHRPHLRLPVGNAAAVTAQGRSAVVPFTRCSTDTAAASRIHRKAACWAAAWSVWMLRIRRSLLTSAPSPFQGTSGSTPTATVPGHPEATCRSPPPGRRRTGPGCAGRGWPCRARRPAHARPARPTSAASRRSSWLPPGGRDPSTAAGRPATAASARPTHRWPASADSRRTAGWRPGRRGCSARARVSDEGRCRGAGGVGAWRPPDTDNTRVASGVATPILSRNHSAHQYFPLPGYLRHPPRNRPSTPSSS